MDIPLPLRNAMESGNAVLFAGAGIGKCALNPSGHSMPVGVELAKALCSTFEIAESTDLQQIAQYIELRRGRKELVASISKHLSDFEPTEALQWLMTLPWRAIFTTNYDNLISRCFELTSTPCRNPVVISATAELASTHPLFEVPVFHLHGAIFHDAQDIIITQNDYARFRNRRRMLFERLKSELATSPIFYVGYSNKDPNWREMLQEIKEEFGPRPLPTSFRLAPDTSEIDREILRGDGITTIDAGIDEFVAIAQVALTEVQEAGALAKAKEKQIPSQLLPAFHRNPASVIRLLASWTFVNQAPFDETPNVSEFLKGAPPNWAVLAQGKHFERDLQRPVLDALLDYATNPRPTKESHAILGPAGFGTTTLLQSLATLLVAEKAGPVFFHRAGTPILEGDVEFATTLFPERVFFFVDNAADYSTQLWLCNARLSGVRSPACFVYGERLNEWRTKRRQLKAVESLLEPLSEAEILRLLRCLDLSGALGKLQYLSHEQQIAVMREKHDRQLLVALREATENNSFDAIIEDEYRNIDNEIGKQLYAAVAAAYQMRQHLRDGVAAAVLNLELASLYKAIGQSVDGVVGFDLIDDERGIYGVRCRHHVIAEILWRRCIEDIYKEEILFKILEALNLSYPSDVRLYEALTRADVEIDTIKTLDRRVAFFESACGKDPLNSYTRQHFARMLLRARRPDLAKRQIDRALEISPRSRILMHTNGVILRDLALGSESRELGRKWMIQSETALSECIAKKPDDAYAYQTLAELYLDWAVRCVNEEEQLTYVEKAELTLSVGVTRVAERDGLWVVSSRLHEWLGNRPKAKEMLKRAQGTVVGRYLLGQLLLSEGDAAGAKAVIERTLLEDPEEYRSAIVYALALAKLGEPLPRAIAVLRASENRGRDDPRFVAILGGCLFMNADFTEAENLFEYARRRSWSVESKRKIYLRASELEARAEGRELVGQVTFAGVGRCDVIVPGFPSMMVRPTASARRQLLVGESIRVGVAFNAYGPIAEPLG